MVEITSMVLSIVNRLRAFILQMMKRPQKYAAFGHYQPAYKESLRSQQREAFLLFN